MNIDLLRKFVRLSLSETSLARVPTQLLTPENSEEDNCRTANCAKEEDKPEDVVDEFSGAGGVAGYAGPLGMNPNKLGRKKNKNS